MNKLKTLSIPSMLLAVAVLAAGCHKTEKTEVDTNGMGPAQTAGKAVDDAGARTEAAAQQAGADARADAHQAGQDIKQGVDNAGDATGKALERTGQKMQDASK